MSQARILVVEDEGLIAEDIRLSLIELGYNVVAVVSTGEEAIRKAEKTRPDIILMDVILKGRIDGIQAANEITDKLHIPIVYLTSYADDSLLSRAKITQPAGYLIKPFRARELLSTIEMALFKHELDRQLKENQEWLSVTLESIADGLIATDPERTVKFMNRVACELTGWDAEEAIGSTLDSVLNIENLELGERIDDVSQLISDSTNGGGISIYNLQSKHGNRLTVEFNGSEIKNSIEKCLGVVLVFRDITQKRIADEKLRLLSEAIAQSSEGIVVLDRSENVLFINTAFAEMHGRSTSELMGRHYSSFHTVDQLPQMISAITKLQTGNHFSGEIWHAHEDGSVFPGLMHISLLKDEDGSSIGIIATLRDITDIKASQQALRASHRELEIYSSTLEQMVEERTRDLEKSRTELRKYSESLEKTNEALKVIIEGIEEQKKEMEKRLSQNLNLTVKPILDQLKAQDLSETVQFLLRSLDFNLNNIFSSFGLNIIKDGHLLTPREIRICEMIRSGLSSKQIAKVMGISPQTVLVHRKNIRKKLSLGSSGQNLASFLKANL
jgi:PAS domain S-box-containing protein